MEDIPLPDHHRVVVDRFAAACRSDARVLAAFLGGSYARGAADAYSDLDLGLITGDDAYDDFYADRAAFVRQLGEPAFLEDFGLPDIVFFIFPDGTECELTLGRETAFEHIHAGPYRVLVDKQGLLADAVFSGSRPGHAEQLETLRRLIAWFWHDLSHFTAAIGRGQLWWAYGELAELRRQCVNLARLRRDFSAPADGYDKVEHALEATDLAPLAAACCPLEVGAMLQAARVVVRYYQELAPGLAATHGLPYPADLERSMVGRLERLAAAQ